MPNTQYDAREHLLHEFAVSDSYKNRTTHKYKMQNVNRKMSTEPHVIIELSIFSIMEKNVQKAFLHDLFALGYLLLLGFIFCCLF